MALDFPSSPSVGDNYTFNSRTWRWNGTGWARQSAVTYTDAGSAPTGPSEGDEWFDTSTGIFYRYIYDGNSYQWVEVGPTSVTTYLPPVPVGGRITLTSGTPVLTAATTGAATVYYSPYNGANIPIFDGSNWGNYVFAELSNVLANSSTGSAGPAAGAASKNYDLFVWNNAGTITLTRGAAWNSDTVRSSATENDLVLQNGIYVNLNTITNGPTATKGTYVGTIRTDSGAATVSFTTAASGTTTACLGIIGLWNYYNRIRTVSRSVDTTSSHTYASTTIRARNNNTGNARIQIISGLAEQVISAWVEQSVQGNVTGPTRAYGIIGLDSEIAATTNGVAYGEQSSVASTAVPAWIRATARIGPQLGFHYISHNEKAEAANSCTFFDTDGGLHVEMWF
jgi:hypothetical protein